MERARRRKSKSASGVEGIVHLQKVAPRLPTDSQIYIDGSKRDDLSMLELGQTSWRGPSRTPMKKLLEEETSGGVEPRKRPPSVIARLMGLEGLPSPRHVHRQQKRLSDTNQLKSRSVLYDGRTTGQPPGPPEFKDVYEDLETASHRLWHRDSPRNCISVLKPYKTKAKPTSVSHISLKREDGLLLERHGRHWAHHSRRPWCPLRPESDLEIEEKILPMKIVVLKPNMGKAQRRKYSSSDMELPRIISTEAREIARDITMRMRDGYDKTNGSRSICGRGYDAGDESSYEGNESDSVSELEGFGLSCSKSFGYPSFGRIESSVNREAKRRLSQRCWMTHNYRGLAVVNNKCSTLGEMLALADRETRPDRLNAKSCPLGISSGDGWIDEITGNSFQSKSHRPGGGENRSRKTSSYHDCSTEKVMMYSETVNRSRSKFVMMKGHKEDYLSKYSKSRWKKTHTCQDMYIGERDCSTTEANYDIQMEVKIKDTSDQQSAFEISAMAEACRSPVVDVMMISEPTSSTLSPEPSKKAQKRTSSSVTGGDQLAVQERCPVAEPEPLEISKEADHPSPNSVLEAPFTEDPSSAESFERISAELREFRLQLQLLKMELSIDADVSTLFPIEDENPQTSPVISKGNHSIAPESWEIHYALDVLVTSNLLQEPDFSMFQTSWYSPNCPLDPNLFDSLEKKYSDDELATGTKWERKLFFDRMNSALLLMLEERIFYPCPWVNPKSMGLNLVEKLIDRLDLSEIEAPPLKAVDREMGWAGPRGEVEMVGDEIERLLMDDMVAEVLLCM